MAPAVVSNAELDRVPTLGTKPVKLSVNIGPLKQKECLSDDMRQLYKERLCCDIVIHCAEKYYPAHKSVLAARSPVFREMFAEKVVEAGADAVQNPKEIRISNVENPEAVQMMLDFIYEVEVTDWKDYNPGTQAINKDVLRLAGCYALPSLTQRATHWLAKDITTGDVVERLAVCREFKLEVLRVKILEQLTLNKAALAEVAHGPKIMQYPELMQSLLQCAASSGCAEEEEETAQAKKRAKTSAKGGR